MSCDEMTIEYELFLLFSIIIILILASFDPLFRTVRLLRKEFFYRKFRRTCSALPASMTVEAAFALPIFIISMCILMTPIRVLQEQLLLQEEAEYAAELGSSAGYLQEELTGEENGEEEIVQVVRTGELNLPFSAILPVKGGQYTMVARRRAWVGRRGGAGREWAGETPAEIPEDETVYVARNAAKSGRYHLDPSCHYISNKVIAVEASGVENLRNASGGRYHPCPSCHPGSQGAVYIFESGDSYHATTACSSLRSYAEAVTRREAEERGLTPCSYCTRRFSAP